MSVQDVIAGARKWHADAADNLPWLQGLPKDCCSLTFTSPPYSDARTYGIGYKLSGDKWVDWMVPRVVEMCRVTDGIVGINMAGKVEDGSYQPIVEWLVAELTRNHMVLCAASPYCFFRFGIPGSGSRHYHRRDWEPIYCFAKPESLPLKWSANTAEGHIPKWAPGGEMSNRLKGGQRVGKFGTGGCVSFGRKKTGEKEPPRNSLIAEMVDVGKPGQVLPGMDADEGDSSNGTNHPLSVEHDAEGGIERKPGRKSGQPAKDDAGQAIANPGNVIREQYDAETVRQLLEDLVTQKIECGDVIRCLAGGGHMGSDLAHLNEAPFPERLVTFFVRSYCPPGGITLDPFCGSGTTLAVAVRHGRRALGCDIRPEQVAIVRRRVAGETPDMFAAAIPSP